MEGDRLVIRPGKTGQLVDREVALRETVARLAAGERTIFLPMREDRPWLSESDLATVRDWANTRLALPLAFEHDGQRWALDRRDLAACLAFTDTLALPRPGPAQPTTSALEARLDAARLRDVLERTVPGRVGLDPAQTAADAALEVRDHRVQLRAARAGMGVDFDALAADLAGRFSALDPAARVAPVSMGPRAPRLSEAQLGPAREQAERLISQSVVVRDAFEQWKLTPEQLESMLRTQQSGDQVTAYLGRDQLLARVEAIAQQAEARTGPNAVHDAAGRPAKVDRLLTASAIWAAAQADQPDQRMAELQWVEGD
jgi:hypothetical protein